MKNLHPKQNEILKILKENSQNPLSIKQLKEEVGITSPGVFYHHLEQLEKKGYLKRNPNNSKDYVVMEKRESSVVYIANYGKAHCGPNGSILEDEPIEQIPIASSLIRFSASDAFIVQAEGDSMEDKIKHGDLVIAKKQKHAEPGDIIVCVYKMEAKIKRYFQKDGIIMLVSENRTYDPLPVLNVDDLLIEGVVKNIISFS